MPLRLNVGLNRKVGASNFGSRGASVGLELELDASLISEPEKLQGRVHELFDMVRVSLDQELNGQNSAPSSALVAPATQPAGSQNGINGAGHASPRAATQSQVKALYAIARNQRLDLAAVLHSRFRASQPETLTIQQASQLIDELKNSTPQERR